MDTQEKVITKETVTTNSTATSSNRPLVVAIAGCIAVLIICCCVSLLLMVASPATFFSFTTNRSADTSNYTVVESDEKDTLSTDLDRKLDEAFKSAQNSEGTVKITLTEKEILGKLFSQLPDDANTNAVKLKIDNNKLNISADIGSIVPNNSSELSNLPIDTSSLTGIILDVELSVNSTGKAIQLDKLSTGNTIFDSLIPSEAKKEFETEFNNAITNISGDNKYAVSKIILDDGMITIEYVLK